jgi:predicted acyl esterase
MPNVIRDLTEIIVDDESNLIFEKNVSIPLKGSNLPIRANVYRPKDTSRKYPVLVTYGPYGKDIYYGKQVLHFTTNFGRSLLTDV